MEDRFSQETVFQPVEGILAGIVPVPRNVFLGQIREGASNVQVVCDELPVEVGESKEGTDIFDLGRCNREKSVRECPGRGVPGVLGRVLGDHSHLE